MSLLGKNVFFIQSIDYLIIQSALDKIFSTLKENNPNILKKKIIYSDNLLKDLHESINGSIFDNELSNEKAIVVSLCPASITSYENYFYEIISKCDENIYIFLLIEESSSYTPKKYNSKTLFMNYNSLLGKELFDINFSWSKEWYKNYITLNKYDDSLNNDQLKEIVYTSKLRSEIIEKICDALLNEQSIQKKEHSSYKFLIEKYINNENCNYLNNASTTCSNQIFFDYINQKNLDLKKALRISESFHKHCFHKVYNSCSVFTIIDLL